MDTKHLRTFQSVAITKNFSKTAEIFDYAQSTVSSHIDKLEEELNVSLFIRKKHGIALTVEGEKFLKYAKMILNSKNEFIDELNRSNRNLIKIAIQESQYLFRYSDLILDWLNKNPQYDIRYYSAHSSFIMRDVIRKQEIDIALITDNTIYTTSINHKLINSDKLILVSNKPIKINSFIEFSKYKVLMTEIGCSYREEMEHFLRKYNLYDDVAKVELLGIQSLINSLLKLNDSIALVPEFVVKDLLNSHLYEVQINYKWSVIHTYLMLREDKSNNKLNELIQILSLSNKTG